MQTNTVFIARYVVISIGKCLQSCKKRNGFEKYTLRFKTVDVRNGFSKDDSDINRTPQKIMMRFYMFSNSLKSDFNFSFFALWYFSSPNASIDRKLLFNGMLELNI